MEIVEIGALVFSAAAVVMIAVALIMQGKRKNERENIGEKLSELSAQLELVKQQYDLQNRALMDQTDRVNNSVVKNIAALGDNLRGSQEQQQKLSNEKLSKLEAEFEKIREQIISSLEMSRKSDSESNEKLRNENRQSLDKINENVSEKLSKLEGEFEKIREQIINSLEMSRKSNSESIEKLRNENRQSLDKINDTVNEKLQKTLNDRLTQSFSAVNERLEQVHKGLGEMKSVASGVSDLKNVLSNVKTRGTLGEIQLGAILEQILAPEQYGVQQAVVPDGSEKVDFAVKIPGREKGEFTYLPIDSKFPQDRFSDLLSAYESGDPELVRQKRAALETEIKREAKSIRAKYVVPPYTTDFAIMFLPSEGLYAEVIKMGLVEVLQNEFRVNVAGPSTMAALLNSLQMGFRAVAIQKKSSEVWKILEAAKKEFGNFKDVLNSARKRLKQADDDLEKLIGTRSRAIEKSLKTVEQLDDGENAEDILKIESAVDTDDEDGFQ